MSFYPPPNIGCNLPLNTLGASCCLDAPSAGEYPRAGNGFNLPLGKEKPGRHLFLPIPHYQYKRGPYSRAPRMHKKKDERFVGLEDFNVFFSDSTLTAAYSKESEMCWLEEKSGGKEMILTREEGTSLTHYLGLMNAWKAGEIFQDTPYSQDLFGVIFHAWLSQGKVRRKKNSLFFFSNLKLISSLLSL